ICLAVVGWCGPLPEQSCFFAQREILMRPAKSVVVLIGMILLLVTTIFGHPQQVIRNPAEPKITDVRLIGLSQLDDKSKKVTFELVIEGENLPDARDHATVHFDAKDPASPVTTDPASLVTDIPVATSNDKEIVVKGAAKAGAEITRIVVSVG